MQDQNEFLFLKFQVVILVKGVADQNIMKYLPQFYVKFYILWN